MAQFLSKAAEHQIIEAIRKAETDTSGEVRVHIEPHCKKESPLERAREVFAQLHMHETELRNGVLIYISTKDHKIAIWGDEGINKLVGQHFWDSVLASVTRSFKTQDYAGGLSQAILEIGEKLKQYFPYQDDDINELPDDISYGDGDA